MPPWLVLLGVFGGVILFGLFLVMLIWDPGPGRQMRIKKDKKYGMHVVETYNRTPDDQ